MLVCAATMLAAAAAPAGSASAQQVTRQDIQARDDLIAAQESLLNVYRCRFGIDTEVVPGGCDDGRPRQRPAPPGVFQGTPSPQELAARDRLVAAQESLLNVYRCRFGIDTEVVPGGCGGDPETQPEPTGPAGPATPGPQPGDGGVMVREEPLAPQDEEGFKARVAPYTLSAHQYFLRFGEGNRFEEHGGGASVGGRFEYRAGGPGTGVLTQFYDGGRFGGSCTTTLSFLTRWSGTLEYVCADGARSSQGWQIAPSHLAPPPETRSVGQGPEALQAAVLDTFEANETRSYDFQAKVVGEEGPWTTTCVTVTSRSDSQTQLRAWSRIGEFLPGTEYQIRYRYRGSPDCGPPVDRPWSHTATATTVGARGAWPPRFPYQSPVTRRVAEGAGPGAAVGEPVSAQGRGPLAYTLDGPDADSFAVVAATGQIRTIAADYDYETKNRYRVTVRVADRDGKTAAIDVEIVLGNLRAPCGRIPNLRSSAANGTVVARWARPPPADGAEAVLGYQIQLRSFPAGSWGENRIAPGPQFTAAAYEGLANGRAYQVRVRPLGNEGDCGWTLSAPAAPSAALAPPGPQDLDDRLGGRWLGAPDHHLQYLSPGRCRYTSQGTASDAYCSYRRTSPDRSEITLEFDDPSRGSCRVALAFSSLTSGSFADECWDAGANAPEPPSEFIVPPHAPRTSQQLESLIGQGGPPPAATAPRNREEFLRFAAGRTDLIPGVAIGSFDHRRHSVSSLPDVLPSPPSHRRSASVFAFGPTGQLEQTSFRSWDYATAGPSRGVLTLRRGDVPEYRFSLEFGADGTLGIAVHDGGGDPVDWIARTYRGWSDAGRLPKLAVPPGPPADLDELDFAPADIEAYWKDHYSRFPPSAGGWRNIDAILGKDSTHNLYGDRSSMRYAKTGHNRARITFTLGRFDPHHPARDHSLPDQHYEKFEGAEWEIDLEYLDEDSFRYRATLLVDGAAAGLAETGIADFSGDRIEIDELPPEIVPPDQPPQERGEDATGAQIAPATTAPQIGPNDLQAFVVRDTGPVPVAYRPGDWLEPKDGGDQRMMIVSATQLGGGPAPGSPTQTGVNVALDGPGHASPAPAEHYSTANPALATAVGHQTAATTSEARLIRLEVVCMQIHKAIPIRGSRYFSRPKEAAGPVQMCQRDCALTRTENIQQCVWKCENAAE